jgi:TonB family protein
MSNGNTPERIIAPPPPLPGLDANGAAAAGRPVPDSARAGIGELPPPPVTKPAGQGLGASLRNLQQFLQKQNYQNPTGGQTEPAADIQFDSKGVDFGPWLRRFRGHVYRHWFMPQIYDKGRVIIQFHVHKDGRITDINVIKPAAIQSFTISAVNALKGANPTLALPADFPDDKILFTVTFIYNERIDR